MVRWIFLNVSLPRVRSFKRVAEMRRELLKDLPEEDVFKELRSPVLDQRDLDNEKSSGLKALLKRSIEDSWLRRALQESGWRSRRLIMLRKWDFPDPKWPLRKIPRPSRS